MSEERAKLIHMLRIAHAIEVGAYHAYEGHWRTIKPTSNPRRLDIRIIQMEELGHRASLLAMLRLLNARQSFFLDFAMWMVGCGVTYACYVSPKFATDWGAKIMETFAVAQYDTLAALANRNGLFEMARILSAMEVAEKRHEEFFSRNSARRR
jgi:demethoxyubiquinone hydroxylase (CLK1/Coq7/Cat5 family)